MSLFFTTLIVLLIAVAAMAVGVIFSNREIKGSCGGLGRVTGKDCMFCGKREECKRLKKVD